MSQSRLILLYVVNATLLITHEIDSGYWKEWDLLHLPGGIQFFLVLHLGLVFLVLFGLVQLTRGQRSGLWFSVALACTGAAAFLIHGSLLLLGHPEFRLPVSLVILGLSLVVSIIQGMAAGAHLVRKDGKSE